MIVRRSYKKKYLELFIKDYVSKICSGSNYVSKYKINCNLIDKEIPLL